MERRGKGEGRKGIAAQASRVAGGIGFPRAGPCSLRWARGHAWGKSNPNVDSYADMDFHPGADVDTNPDINAYADSDPDLHADSDPRGMEEG